MEVVALTYNEMRAKVAELKLEVADTKKQTLITALLKHKASQEVNSTETRGRKVNPNSARQLKLKAIAEREANGEVIKRGRPSDPNSASAKKKAEREARIANGEVIKRGRPAGSGSGVSKKKAEEAVNIRYQVLIDMEGTEEVYSKSFATPKRAITEMKECGFDNYKLKAFNA